MRVDELLIDPVAAALRKLVNIQFARGEHDLAHFAVNLIAINVHIRKIVIGADFLDLAQRVLQGAPIPQPDILKRWLIVCAIQGVNGGFGGELTLRNVVQRVSLPRELDVVA